MKNFYLAIILTFSFSLSLSAQSLYWVGGSGDWEDPNHWATSSNGQGGNEIPDENTSVHITQKSISSHDVITISDNIILSSLSIKNTPGFTIDFKGNYIHILSEFNGNPNGKFVLKLNNSSVFTNLLPQFNEKVTVTNGSFVIGAENKKWVNGEWQIETDSQRAGHTVVLTITQPICNGGTGSCLATASGGNGGPFLYFYTGGIFGGSLVQVNPAVGLTAGSYTSVVLDVSDNSLVFTNFLIIDPFPLNVVFIDTPPSCPGASDGSITAVFNGGTAPTGYTAAWSTGFTENDVFSSTLANIPAGPYSITVVDGNGCSIVRNDTLLDPDPILLNPVITDVSCFGFNTGSIFLNPTSGNPGPFTYLWSPGGEITSFLVNQTAGSYDVHVEDVNGCPKDTTIIITEPTALTASITSLTHLLCNGDCSVGEAIMTPAGGTAPYTYQWFDAGNNPIAGLTDSTATNLCAGTYSVTATDANLCTVTISGIIITEPALLTAVSSGSSVTCNGDSDGTVVVTPSGGTEPYNYLWENAGNPVGTDSLITGLPIGTYDYTVTDANGCVITGFVVIIEPALIDFVLTTVDLICFGDVNGQASVSNVTGGDGNYSYLWLDNGGNTIGTGVSINTLSAGLYTITVTDGNGCFNTVGFEIFEPSQIILTLTSDDVSCFGFSDGAVHVVANGGTVAVDYTYAWEDALSNPVGNTADVFGLPAGTYTVTVTDDNLCAQVGSIDIDEPAPITVVETITDVICNGDADGSISIVVNGGTPAYLFSWTGPNGFSSNNQNISNLEGGNYMLTITDANLCVFNQTYTVNEPSAITFTPTITDVLCFGDATGAITVVVNGGNGGYLYDWRDATNTQISTTDQITNVVAGDYTLTVTDALGCSHVETFTINEASEFFFNAVVTPITCFNDTDGAIDLNPTGGTPGFTYSWTADNGFTSNNQNISNLASGIYTVEVTDFSNCVTDTVITLDNPPELIIVANVTDVNCNGDATGSIELTINGGSPPFMFSWTGPNGFVSTDQDIFNLESGVYDLTVTDDRGCINFESYTVLESSPINIIATITDILCKGDSTGSITVIVSGGNGGYLYDWRDAANVQVGTTDELNNVPAGDYTLIVTDASGCSVSQTFTITEPATAIALVVNSIDVDCAGDATGSVSVLISGGTVGGPGDYIIVWTNSIGVVVGNTQVINNLPADSYIVTVTDLNNCTAVDTAIINSPDPITVSFNVTEPACNGDMNGSVIATPSGGTGNYFYIWENTANPGLIISITDEITNVGAGTYQVQITDANFCTVTEFITLEEPDPLILFFTNTEPVCNGDANGQLEVLAIGGTVAVDYQYEWMDAGLNIIGTNALITGLVAGDYIITVTDDNNCQVQEIITLGEPEVILFVADIVQISCAGDDDGSIAVFVSGGISPYSYEWIDQFGTVIGNDTIVENLAPGDYTFTTTDANGCVLSETYTILELNIITITYTQFELGDCNATPPCIGAAVVFPTGGSGVYVNYQWIDVFGNDLGINNDTATALCSGSYLVTITDSNGCTGSITVFIADVTPETITVDVVSPTCAGELGTATAIYECVDVPCTIEWFDATTNTSTGLTTDVVQLLAGDYFVEITNVTGCKSYFPFTITDPLLIVPNLSATNISCNGNCDGTATASPTGGSGAYTYLWNDPLSQTTATAIDLCPGTYTVIIADALDNTCFVVDSIIVNDIDLLTSNDSITNVSCNGGNDGIIALFPSGGSGLYTYTWNPSPPIGNGTSTGSGLAIGDYSIQIADANNPNCFIDVTYTITQPDSLQATTESVQSTCGNADGEITVNPIGGTPPYSYLWTDAAMQTTQTATGLIAGLYNVIVSDSLGCFEIFTDAVSDIDADTLDLTIEPGLCFGDSSTVTAVYDCLNPVCIITWYDEFGILLPLTGDAVTLANGSYWVGIENSLGCKWFMSFEVVSANPIVPNLFVINESCNGPCDGIASVNPTGGNGGYTFFWAPDPPAGQGTNEATGLCVGTWQITITDAEGCDTTLTFDIEQYTLIEPNLTFTDASCNGDSSGTAEVNPTGGNGFYTYLWVPDPLTGQGTNQVTGLFAGDWNITITDTSGCDTTVVFTILEPELLEADSLVTNASCNVDPGDGSIILMVTGGTPPYSYQWFDAANNDLGVNNDTINNLTEGIYHCIVIDSNLCSQTFIAIISENSSETIIAESQDIVCFGANDGMAWVTYNCTDAPCTVAWYDGLGVDLGLNTDTITNLGPGTYIVGVTNNSGCVVYQPVEVNEPPELFLNTTVTDASCSGVCDGEVIANVVGGIAPYTYLWSPEPGSGQGTSVASDLCAGGYSLLITDSVGCSITFDFTINELEGITSNLQSSDANCYNICDGWATVDPVGTSGNYSYFWSPEPDFGQGTDSVSGLCPGDWSVLITDLDNGCNITDTFNISQPDSIWVSDTLMVAPECPTDNSGSITITVVGGTNPYNYQWFVNGDPISGATDSSIVDIIPGTYTVEIIDANGCIIEETYLLESSSPLTADAGNDTTYCEGNGPAELIGSGNGITHVWLDEFGNVITMGDTLNVNPPPGEHFYIFEVSDGVCTASDTAWIEVLPAPVVDAGPDHEIITDESVSIGGDPTAPDNSTISWSTSLGLSDSTIANPIASPFETTVYIVYVEAENGCASSDTMLLTVIPDFDPNDGFTPNGDGINDVWIIGNIELFPDIEVIIFNRWGELLFSSTGYTQPWDGLFEGKPVPVGTFYYVIDLHHEKYPEPFTGPLTIMR